MLFLIIFCKNQLNNTYIKSDNMSCQFEGYVDIFLVKLLKVNYQGALEKTGRCLTLRINMFGFYFLLLCDLLFTFVSKRFYFPNPPY